MGFSFGACESGANPHVYRYRREFLRMSSSAQVLRKRLAGNFPKNQSDSEQSWPLTLSCNHLYVTSSKALIPTTFFDHPCNLLCRGRNPGRLGNGSGSWGLTPFEIEYPRGTLCSAFESERTFLTRTHQHSGACHAEEESSFNPTSPDQVVS